MQLAKPTPLPIPIAAAQSLYFSLVCNCLLGILLLKEALELGAW
jgi:hypothetical protein